MANFYPWIDVANDNVMSAADFANDSQRKSGFQAGQAASSTRVNSALRQANLFVAALANVVLANNTTLSLTSSLDEVTNALKNVFPFNLPIKVGGNGSMMSTAHTNVFVSDPLSSIVYGGGNVVETNYSACFGKGNNMVANGESMLFMLGENLSSHSLSHPKFITGYNNKDCGDCVRETGAGASTRKTIEKLDSEGNLYVKSLHLSDNIGETDDENDMVLDKTTYASIKSFIDNLNGAYTQYTTETSDPLSSGTYQIFVNYQSGAINERYDFGAIRFASTNTYSPSHVETLTDGSIKMTMYVKIARTGVIQLFVDGAQINLISTDEYKVYYRKIW